MQQQFTVIGAGLVGLATAAELLRRYPHGKVTVLEKEPAVAQHQSGHNSGVLHAGLYYRPGSAKALLAVRGIRAMVAYCELKNIPHECCGKLVVAVTDAEVPRLQVLFDRGIANGLNGLRWLSGAEAREIEPETRCVAAVFVPEEGIVDYPAVARALSADVCERGGEVRTGVRVQGARRENRGWQIETNIGDVRSDVVVNCGGLQSDRIAAMLGVRRLARIVPFRGDYFRLRAGREHLVRNLVYPVPDPSFPFLGVHFTRMIGGGVECGPSAVLAFKREGYGRADVSMRDAVDALTFVGLWRFIARHPQTVAAEFFRAASTQAFTKALQRLIPAVEHGDIEPAGSGVRAQAMSHDGRLVEDFFFQEGPASLHVLNAPSPAATASLAISEVIVDRVAGLL